MEKSPVDSNIVSEEIADKETAIKETVGWEKVDNTLFLKGTLNRDSLLPLWQQKESALAGVDNIEVSRLNRVDTTGLALFVRLKGEWQQSGRTLTLSGVGERLKTLIDLYGLQNLLENSQPKA
ncbi:lipid asymmetry maintenance protein MlaB [Xenorhabdus littoralis]|uniref:lipid asymmetry maintenance protein MlaB n=1 Tax=Xenorhabdus littoralis TaxID=2582835 RepID=UPI0029E7ED29|nr:lipid asymmetry maintenance protein MlaB [Xenorhabdus sp. psl]MDX7990594.1 lipid asymmetry maintenance protein MlaB [Xenorhabdus sp. psl]